jgi:lycopene cyclase domain-containing protein
MTYLEYLAIFILPLLVVAVTLTRHELRRQEPGSLLRKFGPPTLPLLILLAWVWTTPWDSWFIGHNVSSYQPGRYLGSVFHIPYEEFAFMALQGVIAGCWTMWNIARAGEPAVVRAPRHALRITYAAAWTIAAVGGLGLALANRHYTYIGATLAWFGPPLILQCAVGADVLRDYRWVRVRTLVPLLIYLCVTDRIAIGAGAWHIPLATSTGIDILGLPVEEAIFFAITCLLLIHTIVLVTNPVIQSRLRSKSLTRHAVRS